MFKYITKGVGFLSSHIHENVESYLEIYHKLYKELKWKVQNQVLMMISLMYTIHEKEFILCDFLELSEYIKENTGFFTPLHSHQRFSTTAMLITKYENPKEAFHKLVEFQEKLVELGFKKGPYTAITALALMTTYTSDESLDQRINKALDIYKGMKSNHFFLTSQSDYPLSILLSKFNIPIDSLMDEIEFYYSELAEISFKKGNDLQFLSHILMLTNTENKAIIINRCNTIYELLTKEGLKVRRGHYPTIGLMAIIDRELDEEISLIKDITNRFNETKGLKSVKEINLTMAILLVISQVIKNLYDDITIIETGINTTIEALVQAQSAALISSISATSATSTSV